VCEAAYVLWRRDVPNHALSPKGWLEVRGIIVEV
jgi:hypothetical protein